MNKHFLLLIREKIGVILMGGVFLGALSFLFLVVSEKNFKVNTDYLIVQNQTGNQDFYTLVKSSEYIAKVFGEAIYSELFIDEVIKTGKVNSELLPFDKKKRLKNWNKIVKINRDHTAGIINIAVLHDDQREALAVSEGIAEVFKSKSYLFRGHGQDIDIRILSGPILEKNPGLKNIVLVILGGFLTGIMLMLFWIYFRQNNLASASGEKLSLSADGASEQRGNFRVSENGEDNEYEKSLEYFGR